MGLVERGEPERRVARELEDLRTRIAGSVLEPGDAGYDGARRIWNGMHDLRPRAVARAGSTADIPPVLAAARSTGLPLAVRGGGHNVAGHGSVEGGLVLDLSQLRKVAVDTERNLVTV